MSEEIEQLIRSHPGLVVVQLGEPFLEIEQQMRWVAAEVRRWRADAQIVRVELSLHRQWARTHRVHGAPCTLVFQEGRLCIRIRGRYGRARLRTLFEGAGLLEPEAGPS